MEDGTQLLITDASGIYIPKEFITGFDGWTGITREDRAVLVFGPDHEWYWESWEAVCNSAKYIKDGHTWSLNQNDGDLWAIRNDLDFCEKCDWYHPTLKESETCEDYQ